MKEKEAVLDSKIENSKEIVPVNDNKPAKNWPYSFYSDLLYCNNSIIDHIKCLIPTVALRVVCNGITYGPFKAMLDTGAQPNLISASLYRRLKSPTSAATRKLIGIDSVPFVIKRRTNTTLAPWFESDLRIDETFWIMPEQNEFCPILPNSELDVAQNAYDLDGDLADPLYYKPEQVHLTLGVGFVAKIFDRYLRTMQDGTTLIGTSFGAIVMGEHTESTDIQTGKVFSIVDDTLNEKLKGMIEQL